MADITQASPDALTSALIGGALFNFANILLVVAIDIAGMAIAFPLAIGLALVIGVVTNYVATPVGDATLLFTGVGLVTLAIVLDALIYKRLPDDGSKSMGKGLTISIICGIAMGFFYRFVAASMSVDFANPEAGLMTPYSAGAVFSIGLLVSNIVFLVPLMYKPMSGEVAPMGEYFSKGTPKLHTGARRDGVLAPCLQHREPRRQSGSAQRLFTHDRHMLWRSRNSRADDQTAGEARRRRARPRSHTNGSIRDGDRPDQDSLRR